MPRCCCARCRRVYICKLKRVARIDASIFISGSPEGLFKWVLSDVDERARAEGVRALAKIAVAVSGTGRTSFCT
jgi:hypothetical protein